jgi:hypothetical protein
MNEDELIRGVARRAQNPETRTDYADRGAPQLAPPASATALLEAEIELGFAMHPLHRRLLAVVGNGGFGPGDGLIGIRGGRLDDRGRSIIELRNDLWTSARMAGLPPHVLALCDWGDAIWSCLDEQTGRVLTLTEDGLTETADTLSMWLSHWCSGISLFGRMFEVETRTAINPFTKQMITIRSPGRPIGSPYVPADGR